MFFSNVDIAIGAPYDGPSERGAVYIFHGSINGIGEKFSQVIYAEDIAIRSGGLPLETFGFSLSGGLDLDGNDYPDMAAGAYLSDTAFFFRSRPVVKVDARLQFLTTNKQIVLDQKNCSVRAGDQLQRVVCTTLDLCMKFSGVGAPPHIGT